MTTVDYILAAASSFFRRCSAPSVGFFASLSRCWAGWSACGSPGGTRPRRSRISAALSRTRWLQVWVARLLVLIAVVVARMAARQPAELPRAALGPDARAWIEYSAACSAWSAAAVIVGFAVMLAQAAELQSEPWWRSSRLLPLGEDMATVLRGYVDTGREFVQENLPES